MNPRFHAPASPPRRQRGSVLIIVMWICVGLVALVLYFAGSMSAELRAADNRAAEISARQAAAGGMRYAACILKNYASGGAVPDPAGDYLSEALPVGDATFWFIGRGPNAAPASQPVFGLVDEASKLNLNTATSSMLQALPGMTPDLAEAIIEWRTSQSGSSADGAYAAMDPPRRNKGSSFETTDELRLVNGAALDLLLGEDTNRNGALDSNEDDGDASPPRDNQDGLLQPGLLEYVTAFSRQPNFQSSGSSKVNITTSALRGSLSTLLQRRFGETRAAAILANIGSRTFSSVAEFMVASQMTAAEFVQVHTDLTASTSRYTNGLVNVNTAGATVLACIPGIGSDNAAAMVAYRTAHSDELTSLAWIRQVLTTAAITTAGPYITDQSYQFSADIAAVGPNGRGYCREKVVFDTSGGTPRIIYHQDLSQYGWALGTQARQNLHSSTSS